MGAGVGPDGFVQVTPTARLDLSLAPAWKVGAAADASYGRYLASEITSLVETAALEGRWLPDPIFDVTLTAGAEHGSYALGSPLDPGSAASPSVTSTLAGSASSLLRLRSLGLEWRAAGVVATRSSTSAGVDVPELDRAVLAGAMFPVGVHGSLSVTYKLARNDSARPDFALTAHAVFALFSWRLSALDLQAQVQTLNLQLSELRTEEQRTSEEARDLRRGQHEQRIGCDRRRRSTGGACEAPGSEGRRSGCRQHSARPEWSASPCRSGSAGYWQRED